MPPGFGHAKFDFDVIFALRIKVAIGAGVLENTFWRRVTASAFNPAGDRFRDRNKIRDFRFIWERPFAGTAVKKNMVIIFGMDVHDRDRVLGIAA